MIGTGNASNKFWELEGRIKRDKKHPGVMFEFSKRNMIFDIVTLINSGVITTADFPFKEPIDNVEEYGPDQGEHIVATFTNDAKEANY